MCSLQLAFGFCCDNSHSSLAARVLLRGGGFCEPLVPPSYDVLVCVICFPCSCQRNPTQPCLQKLGVFSLFPCQQKHLDYGTRMSVTRVWRGTKHSTCSSALCVCNIDAHGRGCSCVMSAAVCAVSFACISAVSLVGLVLL